MDINSFLLNLLDRKKRDFLTLNQVTKSMSKTEFSNLGLDRRKTSQKQISEAFTPHLKTNLQILQKGTSRYISRSLSPEEMILRKISTRSELSSKQLRNALPFRNDVFLSALNRLLKDGQLSCELNEKTHLPCKFLINRPDSIKTEVLDPLREETDLKKAYEQIGKGRHFVRIHQLRHYLEWERHRFDSLIERLKAEYKIQLQSGDASLLTESELNDSYTDPKGRLRVTITWIGND